MNRESYIITELEQLVPGAGWPAEAPFTAPAGYFAQLPAAVLQRIQEEETPPVQSVKPSHPFSVPSGYFDALPKAILQRLHTAADPIQEELATLSPLLAAIPRQMPFSAPAGYFDTLKPATPATPAPMRTVHRNITGTWLKWAVAACLVAFTGTTALIFLQKENSFNIERQLEGVSDQDIVNYLQTHTDAFDNDIFFASTDGKDQASEDLQKKLEEEIPADAIEKYLEPVLSKEVLPNQ
ncbi:hypothetical protein [Chitinophaga solisilvae]|uniref:Uncharacterized protein n=1 Tax=Chitinophaga solisilvae TaxID=1233460 RepID=A0A3S1CQ09_9BACT|nr:hypothetical protein [Chitinophaga solisilvae]NSL88899.1 hypothetical protein [Chitinophaga solisilvae]